MVGRWNVRAEEEEDEEGEREGEGEQEKVHGRTMAKYLHSYSDSRFVITTIVSRTSIPNRPRFAHPK